jgi:diacylglycerol O-acyltransferase / wax synthase
MTPSFGEEIPLHKRLTDELVSRLAALANQPDGVAEVALSGLGHESLGSLAANGIIEPTDTDPDIPSEILITPFGREAIRICAASRRKNGTPLHAPARGEIVSSFHGALLLQDSANIALHIGAVARFEGPPPMFEEVLHHIRAKLHLIPRARQKLASPLGGLGRQRWVDDPNFNIGYHVRYTALPAPGDNRSLEALVGRIFSQHLDRTKPLWEVWVVDGLENGGFALISKTHFAVIEGVKGIDLVTTLYDLTDESRPVELLEEWTAHTEPSRVDLATTLLEEVLSPWPLRVVDVATPSHAYAQVRQAVESLVARVGPTTPTPKSPLNVPIGPYRRIAFTGVPLAHVKAVKDTFGGTVNDVVLALVASALRSWMQSRQISVDGGELRAASVSTLGGPDEGAWGSRLTQRLVTLPLHEEDPVRRLALVREATENGADSQQGPGGAIIAWIQELAGPTILAQVMRLTLSARLHNIVVANVPGSPLPLYVLGRRMETLHPVMPLAEEHALSISVMSYDGGVYIGLTCDPSVVPDIESVVEGLNDALQELVVLLTEPAGAVAISR